MNIQDHLKLLGRTGVDRVTGFKGVIDSISFDLFGCIQLSLRPPVDQGGKVPNGMWFDLPRVQIKNKKPVMQQPNFDDPRLGDGTKGAADKSMQGKR